MRGLDILISNVARRVHGALVVARQELVVAERAEAAASDLFLDTTEGKTRAEIDTSPVLSGLRAEARRLANAASVIRGEVADHEAALRSRPVMS